jgi:ketosteroid isomerase-like protein
MKTAATFSRSTLMLLFLLVITSSFTYLFKQQDMSINKKTVNRYMEGFNATDHAKILSCLTEDVTWELPGVYLHKGKAAFDKEIENEAFTGSPVIKVSRMTEENNVVIAEGTVQATKKDGTVLHLVFCDVFDMENGLIKKLTSYLMTTPS